MLSRRGGGPPKASFLSFLAGPRGEGGQADLPTPSQTSRATERGLCFVSAAERAPVIPRGRPRAPLLGSVVMLRSVKAEHTGKKKRNKKKEKKNGKSLKEQSPKNAVACTCASWTGRDGPVAQAGRVPGVKSRPATNDTVARVFVYDRELRKAPRVRVGTEAP